MSWYHIVTAFKSGRVERVVLWVVVSSLGGDCNLGSPPLLAWAVAEVWLQPQEVKLARNSGFWGYIPPIRVISYYSSLLYLIAPCTALSYIIFYSYYIVRSVFQLWRPPNGSVQVRRFSDMVTLGRNCSFLSLNRVTPI